MSNFRWFQGHLTFWDFPNSLPSSKIRLILSQSRSLRLQTTYLFVYLGNASKGKLLKSTFRVIPTLKTDKTSEDLGRRSCYGPHIIYKLFVNNLLTFNLEGHFLRCTTGVLSEREREKKKRNRSNTRGFEPRETFYKKVGHEVLERRLRKWFLLIGSDLISLSTLRHKNKFWVYLRI